MSEDYLSKRTFWSVIGIMITVLAIVFGFFFTILNAQILELKLDLKSQAMEISEIKVLVARIDTKLEYR